MPTSAWHYVSPILQRVSEWHAERPIRCVLDVGVGGGKWGMLIRELLDYYHNVVYFKADWKTRIEGIEVFEKYRTPVHDYVYDQIHWGDATRIVDQLGGGYGYDLIIAMKVIEHLEKDAGLRLLEALVNMASRAVILSFPPEVDAEGHHIFDQHDVHGNVHETHRSIWTIDDLKAYQVREITPLCYALAGRARGPEIVAQHGTQEREKGVRLLQGEGAFIEYTLPRPTSAVEIEILKHPWSGTLVVSANGKDAASEDLFADASALSTLRVRFDAPTTTVRLATRANPRSNGQEAWIHAIRGC